MCPFHGSQYDMTEKVIRGPAPLSFALADVDVVEDKIVLKVSKDVDFRTGLDPWWV